MVYYYTFGQAHKQNDGLRMKDYWIAVECDTEAESYLIFKDWAYEFMPRRNHYASVYTQLQFNPYWFPKGEYCCLSTEL